MPVEAGAANTMVTAVLESAGYYYQTVVLDDLTPSFKGSLGALVFLIGVAAAIFSVAVRGSYKFAGWLLIGPPLFFAAVLPRSSIDNAKWKYADMDRPQSWVDDEVTRVLEAGSGSYNVATLFARYNEIVSKSVQEIVKVINQGKTDSDRSFILKGQLLSMVMSRQIQNPFLNQLISQGLFGQCADVANAAKEILDPNLEKAAKDTARKKFDTGYRSKNRTLSPNAARAILSQAGSDFEKELASIIAQPFSCADIWEYTRQLLEKDATEGLEKVLGMAEANLVSREEILKKLALAVDSKGQAQPSAVNSAAANFDKLVKATMKRSLMLAEERRSFAGMIEDTRNRGNDYDVVSLPNESSLGDTEYARGRSTEWSENTRMLTAAGNLPYYQGLLLYFLALAYPFFALLLLVPGKHAAFLLWFVLWLWVKSWDIGMAVVVQLDDILFSILSYARELYTVGPQSNTAFEEQFTQAMWMLRQSDPSFQITTYYNIIATCLLAIPVVMSQFIVGSLSGGAGIVAEGMRASGDAFSSSGRAAQGQLAVSTFRQELLQFAADRAKHNYEKLKNGGKSSAVDRIADYGNRRSDALQRGLPAESARLFNSPPRREILHGLPSKYNKRAAELLLGSDLTKAQDKIANMRAFAGVLGGLATPRPALNPPSITPKVPGIKDPTEDELPLIGAAGRFLRKGAQIAAKTLDSIANTQEDLLPKIAEVEVEWAKYDAIFSDEGRRLAGMVRLYGGLEVPQTEQTGEFKELEATRMYWGLLQDVDRTFTEAMADGVSAGLSRLGDTYQSDAFKNARKRAFRSPTPGFRP